MGDIIDVDTSQEENGSGLPNLSDSKQMMYTSTDDSISIDDNHLGSASNGLDEYIKPITNGYTDEDEITQENPMKLEDRPEVYKPTTHSVDGNDNQITENSDRKTIDHKMMKKDESITENLPNSRKMINEMQFIEKPHPLSTSIRPSQNIYRVDNKVNEDIDPKEEAVLKQVREFLYQNMNLETKVVVNTLRRLIPHGKGMVKRLDNQPRMEDVFSTNSRTDNDEHINLTDEHLFVFYSTLLELQKILESALVLTKKNAGEKMEETEAESQNIRKMVPLLTKMRYQSMLPVLKMASVHNVELVKFFFKLLYQADTQKPEIKDKNSKNDRMYHMEMVPISERTEAREHFAY